MRMHREDVAEMRVASYRSHEAIVKLLVDEGADVNVQGGKCIASRFI